MYRVSLQCAEITKRMLDAPLGEVVSILEKGLDHDVQMNLVEQNTSKPGTEFTRKVTVTANGMPLVRATIRFDTKDLPEPVARSLLNKKTLVGAVLEDSNLPCHRKVISMKHDMAGNKFCRTYIMTSGSTVLFDVCEEIKLDYLDHLMRSKGSFVRDYKSEFQNLIPYVSR